MYCVLCLKYFNTDLFQQSQYDIFTESIKILRVNRALTHIRYKLYGLNSTKGGVDLLFFLHVEVNDTLTVRKYLIAIPQNFNQYTQIKSIVNDISSMIYLQTVRKVMGHSNSGLLMQKYNELIVFAYFESHTTKIHTGCKVEILSSFFAYQSRF